MNILLKYQKNKAKEKDYLTETIKVIIGGN
jgi:hypothetical protein